MIGLIRIAMMLGRIQMKQSTILGVSYAIIKAVIHRFSTAKPKSLQFVQSEAGKSMNWITLL